MKILPAALCVAALISSPASATAVGISIVEQPVNLATRSDPSRIPLGRVGVVSNYNYGIHGFIAAPRPCPDGAMRWDGGSELDQNLASVFGITVEPEDPTQISRFQIVLRMKPWPKPAYSPYSKEQVLAATLWCLLRSAGGTPESPLKVQVVADGPDDKPLEAKYSGNYVTRADEHGVVTTPPEVAGTEIEEDARGIAWVRFAGISQGTPPPQPAMILLDMEREESQEWVLLPVWGDGARGSDFLRLTAWQTPLLYSAHQSTGATGANSFLAKGGAAKVEISRGEASDSVTIAYPRVDQATLAAQILALVISAQPSEARPLKISMMLEDTDLARYPDFRGAGGWEESRTAGAGARAVLTCEFTWDATTGKLVKGTLPEVAMQGDGILAVPAKPAPATPDPLAAGVRDRIEQGMRDGGLLAENVMPPDHLAGNGLRRHLAMAGYYEALAAYANGESLPAEPREDPFATGASSHDQAHQTGWVLGIAQAGAIALEVRRTSDLTTPETTPPPSPDSELPASR